MGGVHVAMSDLKSGSDGLQTKTHTDARIHCVVSKGVPTSRVKGRALWVGLMMLRLL
jgi:hypothetical protein